ncbi:MAG: pantetheine-phosphate adenylyltransferase [Halobacteriovoraceae bacterium]|nr:pantetheine-phosphate adenylyltransferase [Halobacteriovoraceae bacterium]|tara:strand:- start:369 stop:863 length:495 start_codon:yes stop_codon:yes gene_type:complete
MPKKESIALYAISANPPTWGHADIMMRAAKKFDKLYFVYATNPKKQSLFSDQEKEQMMKIYVDFYGLENVIIDKAEGAVVRYAKNVKADCLIRGLRSSSDFQYEYELSIGNRGIAKNIETFCMFTKPHYATISSSIVRELASLQEEIKQYVHKDVKEIIVSKFR